MTPAYCTQQNKNEQIGEKIMARKKQVTLVLFPDLAEGTKTMSSAQLGDLMRGIFAYRFEGKIIEFDDPMVAMAFNFIKPQLTRYDEICEINRTNRNKKAIDNDETVTDNEMQENVTESDEMQQNPTQNQTQNQTQTQNQNQNQTQKKKKSITAAPPHTTIPPTVEAVRQYCTAKGIGIDPQRFVDYYTANGWMVGRTKMKDWTAAVRTWNAKEKQDGKIEHESLWTVGTVL